MDLLNRPQYDPETGNKIYLFAQQEPAIYGIISILLAVFAGFPLNNFIM